MEKIVEIENPGIITDYAFMDTTFVKLTTNDLWEIRMQYPHLHMQNAETECFVRQDVYEMLILAAGYLPKDYRFCIWDAWRPFSLQKELYTTYSDKIIKQFSLESASQEEKEAMIRKFVSDPIPEIENPPVHTTGGAIDLTIIDAYGKPLNMGCEFDAFTEKTYTVYFENTNEEEVKINRRLLYSAMTKAGFTNLPSEWWHYDYGDKFWAYYKNKPVIYKGVFTKENTSLL